MTVTKSLTVWDTSTIARPKLGKVRYGGVGIYDCVNNGDIAVTFDDGPYEYTNDLLDKFAVCVVISLTTLFQR